MAFCRGGFSLFGAWHTNGHFFRRLNDRQFQQLLGRLIFVSGLVIGDRELVTHSFFGQLFEADL